MAKISISEVARLTGKQRTTDVMVNAADVRGWSEVGLDDLEVSSNLEVL